MRSEYYQYFGSGWYLSKAYYRANFFKCPMRACKECTMEPFSMYDNKSSIVIVLMQIFFPIF